ncbi:MAG: hypothetical protein ACPG52_09155 [Cognaticolwellia sp.]
MKIDIQNRLHEVDQTLVASIEQRLIFAFSKVEAHISAVILIISQVDIDDGQLYPHCTLKLSLNRFSDVVVEETQKDLLSAINRVIQKAIRIVFRKILLGKSGEL